MLFHETKEAPGWQVAIRLLSVEPTMRREVKMRDAEITSAAASQANNGIPRSLRLYHSPCSVTIEVTLALYI